MKLSEEEVLQTAQLARLHLPADDVESTRRDLAAILGYVEALGRLDVTGVEPMTHAVEQPLRLRPDVVGAELTADEALSDAPRRDGDLFVVPKVVEGSG